MDIVFKMALTGVLLFLIYYIWTVRVDVSKTLTKPLTSIISIKKESRLDIDFKQVTAARFRESFCLLFYVLRFVNSSDENVTVKEILLRVGGPSGKRDIDSTVVVTGEVQTQKKELIESIVLQTQGARANIVLMNWKNLRPILGEYKTLSPGAVLGGSAVFVLDGVTIEQLRKFNSVELVAVDFSGNEIVKQIDVDPQWVKQAEDMVVADRDFLSLGGQEITWR